MRSFHALAVGLSLLDLSAARVAHKSQSDIAKRESDSGTVENVVSWFNRLLRKSGDVERRAALAMTCDLDAYYDFVDDSDFGQSFCSELLNYPNVTVVSDYTPISTVTNTISTRLVTEVNTVRYTPVTTTNVTAGGAQKRDAQITNAPRAISNVQVADVLRQFRRQNAAGNDTSSVPSDAQLSASFSSACACHSYSGSTVVSTYTNEASTVTQSAFYLATTTVSTTRTAAQQVTTVTVSPGEAADTTSEPAAPESTGSATSSAPVASPTAEAFSCPEDNNVTVSQMIGSMRYDYLVLCDTDITDADVYSQTTYGTFSECAAACSIVDTSVNGHVCEGFSFYGSTGNSANCFLKGSVNNTVAALGVDSAILQQVAVGLSGTSPAGTNTESAPFADPTSANPSDISSTISEILSGSSTSISVITPAKVAPSGLLVNAGQVSGVTSYSTYVSDGTTFSTGSVFSTYESFPNGAWYSSYYTSYSVAWASATVVYASSETGTSISNMTNSESSSQSGADGNHYVITTTNTTTYFPTGYNVTTVVSNVTYDENNSQIASTATTYLTSYETGGAGGGGAGGASGAGLVTSSAFPGSTSVVTVISTSGASAGGSGFVASGAVQTPAPSVSATTIINTFGTAYSSGFAVSGGFGGAGGASGTGASGQVPSSGAPLTPISSTVVSTGVSGESGIAGSGNLIPVSSTVISTDISGETGLAGSGALTPISSTLFSTGISGSSGTVLSGSLPSTVSPFTNTNAPRSGTESSSLPTGVLPSSGSPFSPISSAVGSTGFSGASSTFAAGSGLVPTGSSTLPFTNSGAPRSGTESTVLPTGVIPSSGFPFSPISSSVGSTGLSGASSTFALGSGTIPSSGLIPTGSSPLPFTNSGAPRSGTESLPSSGFPASSGFAPSGTAPVPAAGTTISEILSFPNFPGGQGYGPNQPVTATPSSGLPFTNSGANRSGFPPSSGFPAPSGTAPLGTGPLGTAPLNTAPLGTAPLGTAPLGTAPLGTAPLGTAPLNTAPVGTGSIPPFSNTELPRSGSLPSSGFPAPTGTAPLGTGSAPSSGLPPFSNTELPRSGTAPSSGFPAPTGSLPSSGFPPFPTAAPSSCVTNYLGTTTMWTTVTSFGCYSNCPAPNGYGGSPLTFGPPGGGYNGGY